MNFSAQPRSVWVCVCIHCARQKGCNSEKVCARDCGPSSGGASVCFVDAMCIYIYMFVCVKTIACECVCMCKCLLKLWADLYACLSLGFPCDT